ncbi:hypothetical protein [Parachlamydia sp. AcF125]|uniref:hypothetical protein n=1 Tax=Parachlamydia sp. AcF125 TaxID=2795736 RepID=UPI001BD8AF3E|nr:hypothetical protein [Parachlamydia sp. AcF125]MBS4167727.1 hypothetical protein [Parachlamydia sp. AcF125]
MIKIRTSIDTAFKKKLLFEGTVIAMNGALVLFAGLFLPPGQLSKWGEWIFLVGVSLIAWGLLPYRKLTLLEATPNELGLEQDALYFSQRGKPALVIPMGSIDTLSYGVENHRHGLYVFLKPSSLQKIPLLSNRVDKESCQWIADGKKFAFFFPHFSQRSCEYLIGEFQELGFLEVSH